MGQPSRVSAVIEELRERGDCLVLPPVGPPRVRSDLSLPADLSTFYRECGGVVFTGPGIGIVPPSRFLPVNEVVLGELHPEDVSSAWYLVAEASTASTAERISIDLRQEFQGRCYDSFWDRHGVAGSMPVVARSFTELLEWAAGASLESWQAGGGWPSYGDAYDPGGG